MEDKAICKQHIDSIASVIRGFPKRVHSIASVQGKSQESDGTRDIMEPMESIASFAPDPCNVVGTKEIETRLETGGPKKRDLIDVSG